MGWEKDSHEACYKVVMLNFQALAIGLIAVARIPLGA